MVEWSYIKLLLLSDCAPPHNYSDSAIIHVSPPVL
jgi:hypothetical protein